MNRIWTDAERQFVIENANVMKDSEIAVHLTRISGRMVSLQAVRKQRQKLGIAKKPGRGICSVVKQEENPLDISLDSKPIDGNDNPEGVNANID